MAPCPPLGAVVPGYAVDTVVQDTTGRFAAGQWVTGLLGWAQYAVAEARAAAGDPAALAVLDAIKAQLDPQGLMNPGVLSR